MDKILDFGAVEAYDFVDFISHEHQGSSAMTIQRSLWIGLVATAVMLSTGKESFGQVVLAPAPVVSYYVPTVPAVPTISYYAVPAPPIAVAPIAVAPVAYYTAPAPVAAMVPSVPATVSYYTPVVPATVPARVSRGLFGRTIIRTPYSKTKF